MSYRTKLIQGDLCSFACQTYMSISLKGLVNFKLDSAEQCLKSSSCCVCLFVCLFTCWSIENPWTGQPHTRCTCLNCQCRLIKTHADPDSLMNKIKKNKIGRKRRKERSHSKTQLVPILLYEKGNMNSNLKQWCKFASEMFIQTEPSKSLTEVIKYD